MKYTKNSAPYFHIIILTLFLSTVPIFFPVNNTLFILLIIITGLLAVFITQKSIKTNNVTSTKPDSQEFYANKTIEGPLSEEEYCKHLLDELEVGLLHFKNGELQYCNPYFETISSRKQENLKGKSKEEIFTLELESAMLSSEGTMLFISNADGSSQSFKIEESEISSFEYILTIHNQKFEKKIDIKKHKLEVMGQLANGIAHDFNNILAGIIGAVELLDENSSNVSHEYTTIIRDAANRATDLTHRILSFSQKEYTENVPIDLHKILESTIKILERTLCKKVTITKSLEASSSTIMGDRSILQSIFINLGINAENAMPDGGMLSFSSQIVSFGKRECMELKPNLKPGAYIEVEVKDTGVGIPQEYQDKIFDPFFTMNGNKNSMGLGLTNAYNGILSMGGEITVQSSASETIFTITIPLEMEKQPIEFVKSAPVSGNKNVLIVDDEEVIRLTARAILENEGYTIFLATNGVEALNTFRENDIDIVIMDMIMPEMDGKECLKELQKMEPEVKVILVTGFVREKDVIAMKQNGLLDVITKPFDPTNLVQIIATALSE